MTLLPNGGSRGAPAKAGGRGIRLIGWSALGFVALAAVLWALEGDEIASALASFPPIAAIGAVACHLCWLGLRGEAWRLSLNAVGEGAVPRPEVHAANGTAFLAGVVQAASTVPIRALALRRFARERSPVLEKVLVADAPVIALEGLLMAAVLGIAALSAPVIPGWLAALILAAAVAALALLGLARERFRGRSIVAGLRVLGDRRRRVPLSGLVVAMGCLGLGRAWIVLAGFGLPHGFASAAVLLAALGVLGVLPIGLSSSPGATLVVFGAIDASTAAAAGVAMAATSLAAITLYGGASLATLARARREPARDGEVAGDVVVQ